MQAASATGVVAAEAAPAAKRSRLSAALARPPSSPLAPADGQRFFSGVKVFLPSTGIPFLSTKAKLWRKRVEALGGALTQDPKQARDATHIVVGEAGIPSLPPLLQPGGAAPALSSQEQGTAPADPGPSSGAGQKVAYVNSHWLESCLAKGRLLPAADYPPPDPEADPELLTPTAAGRPPSRTGNSLGGASKGSKASKSSRASVSSLSSLGRWGRGGGASQRQAGELRRWLGEELWHEGCEEMSLTELALQAVYSEGRSRRIGNEHVVRALKELSRYERALHQDYYSDEATGQSEAINHRALSYSRAAAIVRACSYRLEPDLRGSTLPFVGEATAQQINDIIATGTCRNLDLFRMDEPVTDSRGRLRPDSVGAATRARFHALPGVGQKAAKRWWDLGCRSYEDVERMAQPGGALAPGGTFPLTAEQRFSLRNHRDLLEGTNPEEVEEMRGVVAAALQAVSGRDGWQLELVGGGRRSAAVHDADFLATHPEHPLDGLAPLLAKHLVQCGRMYPPSEAMCRVQTGLLPTHIEVLRQEHLRVHDAAPSRENMDKFEHVYGIYRTQKEGKARRLDVIICPPEEWSHALVGWIGSRQYLCFMRQLAKAQGYFLGSHRLLRKAEGESWLVPEERPPVNRQGDEEWPPGWHPGRRVERQADVFELLGIPYREPHERNA